MKALKSPRAKVLLSDPAAKERFRRYLSGYKAVDQEEPAARIEIRARDGRVVEVVTPVIVPKAA
jgi:hypothetical protein